MPTKKHLFIICLLLTLAAFTAFWQVTASDFISYDDWNYVTENSHIQSGLTLEGIRWAFTTGYASNWHPLTWISHMLDVQLFGMHPGWHHLINLLFHCANTVLLFLIFHRMTGGLWQSAFVAALFALHPLHVESVAWVAERKDVLSTFFWMLTMGMYVSYVGRPGLTRYLGLLCCFALGLMAKPMLVTLPFVLLLLDYWPLQRLEEKKPGISRWSSIRFLLIEKIPLLALSAISSIVTYFVQQHGGAMQALETLTPSARIANAFVSCVTYMVKMLWPANLAVLYPHPGWWPLWKVLGSVAILIVITVVAVRGIKKWPYVAVGWFWYAGTLVPVIGIVPVGMQAMADRYTYVPLVGLFIIVAWGVPEFLKNRPHRKAVLTALSALCLLWLFLLTWTQVGYWRNSITLYDHALKVTDRNSAIRHNRGVAYHRLGKYTQAIADYTKAIEINPQYGKAYINRGTAYLNLGKYTQAIADYTKAIEINPKYGEAYVNRGAAYSSMGDYTQAIADFDRAIEINPKYGEAYRNRGMVNNILGNHVRAIDDMTTAARFGDQIARNLLRNQGIGW
jgi:regulator of sirC expression with transglutaminase-like and TPR domain